MEIRLASMDDAEDILAVYAPYVRETAVTFEYDVPDADTFRRRVETIRKEYPYLVAAEDGKIVGYAYASAFHERAAYRHTAETSIYLARNRRMRGIGTQLYRELEKRLLRQNVFVLYACVTATDRKNDAFLTDGSILFHEKMGYTVIGKHHLCGYKFDQWYSVVWMEKVLRERPEKPEPFIPFSACPEVRSCHGFLCE